MMETNTVIKEKPLILAIDDDPNVSRIINLFLGAEGYSVALASSGLDAFDRIARDKPDLIFLDIMMTEMNGYEVCDKLQKDERTADIPIIFVSALYREQDRMKAMRAGAVDFLIKPFTKEVLIQKVKEHLKYKFDFEKIKRRDPTNKSKRRNLYDFEGFKVFLMKQLNLEEDCQEEFSNAIPEDIYDVCEEQNIGSSFTAQLIAEYIRVPYMQTLNPNDVKLGVFPMKFSRTNKVVAIKDIYDRIQYAVSNPFDLQIQDMLFTMGLPKGLARVVITEPENFDRLFAPISAKATKRIADGKSGEIHIEELGGESEIGDEIIEDDEAENLVELASQAPVVRMANLLIQDAIDNNASDLHVEPRQTGIGVRYRIDGQLVERESVPKYLGPSLISRFKIMAKLDISNRRLPQDGRIRISYKARNIDLRVSTLPSHYGEKVVIRIIDNSQVSFDFNSLGFQGNTLALFQERIKKPHGIILLTGPTGSGKTTTLYSILNALNDPAKNIVTVEDPIENEIHRITQVQIHPEAGMTFPTALRSILRQDPDIIMIGEMRDQETADIAIKAALTGHLVLSTLHTNDAPSSLVRLMDMGIPSFLVSSSLEMIVAQRLLRKLCNYCKQPTKLDDFQRQYFSVEQNNNSMTIYQPVGCAKCHDTGYKGRIAAVEVLVVDEQMREMISAAAEIGHIRQYASKHCGFVELKDDAFFKAASGITSIEEVLRITGTI